jgi:uridine kinase
VPDDPAPPHRRPLRARVIVVAGPSGSGKSRLCERLRSSCGTPVLNLDDFYKSGDDPSLPRRRIAPGQEIVDWDDPRSWSREDALTALEELCRDGTADVPVYDISADGRTGHRRVSLDGAAYLVAEGIFAQEVIRGCRDADLLADAVCVRNSRLVTFWRRLTRDLREHRKPPLVLLRRGWLLFRAEPRVVGHAVSCGATALSPEQAYRRLSRLVSSPRPARRTPA